MNHIATTSALQPLARNDIQEVADLLVRVFQNRNTAATPAMTAYLETLTLELPDQAPGITSMVHRSPAGAITGFIGIFAQQMQLNGQPLIAAVGHSIAVDPAARDPMAASLLLRAYLNGPQSLCLSDRVGVLAMSMCRRLKGESLPQYSLEWLRILHPAGYAAALARRKSRLFNLARPLANLADKALASRAQKRGNSSWVMLPPSRPHGVSITDAATDELLDLIPQMVSQSALHPAWSRQGLSTLLSHAAQKSELGPMSSRVVRRPDGEALGLFLYHSRPGEVAQVLCLLHAPGREGIVLDALLSDALAQGAVAVGGRTHPLLLDALMDRGARFSGQLRYMIFSRDAAVKEPIQRGDAMLTGLVGEYWTRLNYDGLH